MNESSGYRIPSNNQVPTGNMSSKCSFVLHAVFTGFLALCCVGLVGVILWREYYTESSSQEPPMTNITIIKQRFPGYFRTPQEQAEIEKNMNFDPVVRQVSNISAVHKRCFFNGHCENKTTTYTNARGTTLPPFDESTPIQNLTATGNKRRRRQASVEFPDICELDRIPEKDLTFHGCCISYTSFIQPTTLPTAEPMWNGLVQVVQFTYLQQYFSIQECCQARECSGCQCSQTYYTVTAVVWRRNVLRVEFVRLPGCCQCLNTY